MTRSTLGMTQRQKRITPEALTVSPHKVTQTKAEHLASVKAGHRLAYGKGLRHPKAEAGPSWWTTAHPEGFTEEATKRTTVTQRAASEGTDK